MQGDDFQAFAHQGATRCTDVGENWLGEVELWLTLPRQIGTLETENFTQFQSIYARQGRIG